MHVHVLCGCMEVTVRSHQFKQGWDGMGWDGIEERTASNGPTAALMKARA